MGQERAISSPNGSSHDERCLRWGYGTGRLADSSVRKYRLLVGESEVRSVGIFREKSIRYDEVRELTWRCMPQGGSVRLDWANGYIRIDLGNFSAADRASITARLRHSIDASRQQGWEVFQDRFGDSPKRRAQTRWTIAVIPLFLAANAIGFFVMWLNEQGHQYLAMALINVVATFYSVRLYRKHCKVEQSRWHMR